MKPMSVHDRMLAVYRGEIPDQIPIGIYSRYLPRSDAERPLRNLGLGIIEYHPVVSMPGPPWHLYPGYLSEIDGAELNVKHCWDGDQYVERREYRTPIGEVSQEIVHDPGGIGSEHIRKQYVTCPEDYRVMTYLVNHSVIRSNEETIRRKIAELGDDGIVLGRVDRSPYQKCLIELVGPERFLIDLLDHAEPALELLDALDRKLDESFDRIHESAVEVIWQPDNITSDMTPPAAYQAYCLPFYQKHGTRIEQAGKPYVVHLDGRIRALEEGIRESRFNVIESLSLPTIGGDMTLSEAQRTFSGKVVIPNLPANWCLRSDEEIESLVSELLDEADDSLPFMLQISEDLPASAWMRVLPIVLRAVSAHSEKMSRRVLDTA